MALNEGTEKNESNSNSNLEELVRTLQKQVAELTAGKQPEIAQPGIGGLSPEQFKTFMEVVTNTKNKDVNFEEGVDESLIPVDDYDEKGVRFCVPTTGYVMSCDRRKGKIVKLPFGKKTIFFEHEGTRKRGQGKFTELSTIAAYTSYSKKEIEWIRNHSMYGVLIYESSNSAMNADMVKIQKLSRAIAVLRSLEHIDVVRMCKGYDVQISDDLNEMRFNIAHEQVRREMEAEGQRAKSLLESTTKESLLLDTKN